jgi:hypothetical protein
MTAFTTVERDLTLAVPPCDQKLPDIVLTLRPRNEPLPVVEEPTAGKSAATPPATGQPATAGTKPTTPAQTTAAGRAAGAGTAGARFTPLNVQSDANGTATLDVTSADQNAADVARLLPPGFSIQSAGADAVAINGAGDATSIDRSMMNDRMNAIGRGEFDPTTGMMAAGGMGGFGADQSGAGGFGDQGGMGGGRGGGGRGGPGGPGGGGFQLGGRGGRGQSLYQGSANYTFGGSVLDSPPFQINPTVPVTQPQFTRNNFGGTFGGPVKIPGLYADTNRRTNFQLNYTGSSSGTVFDQYATVPTAAERAGDFSSAGVQLINPVTKLPFASNQVPVSQAAAVLLPYIPLPNTTPGLNGTNNYHTSGITPSTSNSVSVRITQNLSPTVAAAGRGGGRGGAAGGGGRGGGAPGGRGGRGLNIMLNAQVQYRESNSQSLSVFPGFGSTSKSTSVTVPLSLNVSKGRTVNTFTLNYTKSSSSSTNLFSGVNNVAGLAGINYPTGAITDPLNYGVPSIAFSGSGFNSLRGPTANQRTDSRITASYVWSRPIKKHQLRIGADYRDDLSSTESNGNARGSFTFTGLYSSGLQVSKGTGADFADFLLGMPQQATIQVGGITHLRSRSFDAYVEDNWQRSGKLTFQLGLRYELAMPYVETNGFMANLDVAPDFSAVQVVQPGGAGQWHGVYPNGLVKPDTNNWGPRAGVAYRLAPNTILRGSYSVTYNSGSYASIARQLVGQPPFSVAENVLGSVGAAPLSLQNALVSAAATSTNNFGVDPNYQLGVIQTWNATVSRNFSGTWRNWSLVAGYTGTKGTNLDQLRAPNRGPNGLLVPGVQAFTWESSGAHSILQSTNFSVRRRLASGFSGGVNYTLAKSMDNASSLGGGGGSVAQNDQDLGAEWALSSFDRRHQVSSDVMWEIPFGVGRRWLTNGGFLASIIGDWSFTTNFSYSSGSPNTIRVVGAAGNVASGSNGSLRADYLGGPIQLSQPIVDPITGSILFFNTAAFAVPAAGTFGNSLRNMVIGPSSHTLNANFNRDIRLGGTRAVSLTVNVTNLLNTKQFGSVNTNFNSTQFGTVTSFRGSRTMTISARFRF